MIETINTDENLNEYVDRYSQFGINIISHKTKLAKKIYLLILSFIIELFVTILCLNNISDLKN